MSTNYAVIDNNVVTNIIVLEKSEEPEFAAITGWTLIYLGDPDSTDYIMCQLGWIYDPSTNTFQRTD